MRNNDEIMKKIAWILVVFSSIPSLAQQNFASISFGASLPLGEYGMSGDLSADGYANTGGAIKFDAGYFPGSYLGIGGSFSFGSNFAKRDSMLEDLITYLEENSSLTDIPGNEDTPYGSGFWNYINLFIGPHFSFRASQKLYFDFRSLAGLCVIRPPDQKLAIAYDDKEISSHVSSNKLSFGFTAGTGFRVKLNPAIALKFGADYTQARSSFTYKFELFDGGFKDVPDVESDFLIRTLEISAGLAYSF